MTINPLMLLHHNNMAMYCSQPNAAGTIWNFPYTGSVLTITLGKGIYKLEVWGAEGGYRSSQSYSGKGGYSVGTITLTDKATTLYVYSGGSGRSGTVTSSIYEGGFNGGGYRYGYYGGGGGSDIRIGTDSLYARVIVAGGGGSDGATNKNGMYGGGESGGAATQSYGSYGYGGTQTGHTTSITMPSSQYTTNSSSNYPGGFGFGGFGVYRGSGYGGAGGGGWYGGCGSYPDSSGDDDRGGGGGSGYIYTTSTASNYPSGCLLTSKYYLSDASMKAGNTAFTSPTGTSETGHYGDGYCRITCIKGVGIPKPEFVEYIESTGSLYIDTGYVAKSENYRVKSVFSLTNITSNTVLFGGGANTDIISILIGDPVKFYVGNGSVSAINSISFSQGTIHTIDCYANNGTLSVSFDGNNYTGTYSGSINKDYSLALFGNNIEGNVSMISNSRIYSCQIYDNSTLVRDYVPARQNGIFGLWDKVEKKFYRSASNTQFLGKANLPQEYTQVNYIESSGTQYLDTGFTPNLDTTIKMMASSLCTTTSSNPGAFFFGSSYPDHLSGAEAYLWNNNNVCVGTNLLGSYYTGTVSISAEDLLDIQFVKNNCNIYRLGVNVLSHTSTYTSFTSGTTLLFCRIPRQSVYWGIVRIYYCLVYDNEKLIRDYIPVRNSSGVYGLYDLVNKTFTSSATSTQFTGG